MQTIASTLHRRSRLIVLAGIIGALVAFLLSIAMPLEYRADAQVLLITQARFGTDPYTAARSSERIGENLAQVMTTNDFYEKVIAGRDLDLSRYTNVPERTKRKRWQKAVNAGVSYGTGVLNISAYDRKPEAAITLAQAVVDTLVANGYEYIGGGVTIRMVNAPVATRFPARPNIPVNTAAGFVVGVVVMSFLVLRKRTQVMPMVSE